MLAEGRMEPGAAMQIGHIKTGSCPERDERPSKDIAQGRGMIKFACFKRSPCGKQPRQKQERTQGDQSVGSRGQKWGK